MTPSGLGAFKEDDVMLAVFATAAFLATLWMIGVVAWSMMGESRTKILAALNGRSLLANANAEAAPIAIRVSQRSRLQRPVRAQPQLRAAA
jgi:hypothetical protein